jgi:GABA permease
MAATAQLQQGLSQRQLMKIAIGGIIGAGFFVGSGVAIGKAGPAAVLTYVVCGVLVILVMRMLGEMATANPSTGSFADYARQALGGWAGFSVGWLYWYYWVIVVGFEAVAGAKVITYWFQAPLWLLSLILMMLMTATNLFSVSSYGEFEFWFAGIKVVTILLFLLLGSMYAFGLWPHRHADFSNLHAHGGFFPNGLHGAVAAIVTVIFSMVGAEIATIAAAETPDPQRAVQRATNAVAARIAIFFVGSVFLLTVILPWNSVQAGSSPFVAALKQIGIPGADEVMNAVVLTAVLSCLNSGLYSASRVLFVLAGQHEAPARMLKVSRRGVPYLAIVSSSAVGFLCVIMAGVAPNTVFQFLLNSSGAIVLLVYLLIALSQIVLRRKTPPEKLRVKMWLFPGLSILTVAGIAAVLVQMAFDSTARTQFWLSLLSWAVTVALYFLSKRWHGRVAPDAEEQAA